MNILVTAIGSMSAEAVVSSLKKCSVVNKVYGSDIYPKDWLPTSRLVDGFYQVPLPTDKDYLSLVAGFCTKHSVDAIIPLTDPEIDMLSVNRNLLENKGIGLYISDHDSILICRDKLKLFSFFNGHKTVKIIPTYDLHDVLSSIINYPLIGKPRKGRSSEGLQIFYDQLTIRHLKERLHDYIFQPVIDGDIYTVDVVRDTFKNCFSIARTELLRTKNGAGITVEMQKNKPLVEMTNQLAELLDIKGCINIEYIYKDRAYFLMDVNPRFSAGITFSQMSGYNMVESHLRAFIGKKILPPIIINNMVLAKHYKDYYM